MHRNKFDEYARVFKGINRLYSSDSARVLSDEHEDDKPSVDKGDQQT
jgi:hypothetical protein